MQNTRNTPAYKQWVKKVKSRDGEACRRCGFDKDLEAHHIMPLQVYPEPEYAYWVDNGLTLCKNCHLKLKNKELTTNLIEFIEKCSYFHNGPNPESRKAKIVEQLCPLLYHATFGLGVLGKAGDETLRKAKRHTREAAAAEKQRAGKDYLLKADFDLAIEYCTEAIRLDPEDAETYNNRGVAYHEKGDYERAILDYNQAIRFISDWAIVYANRGDAYLLKGDCDWAIADYYQILRIQLRHFPIK